MNRNDPVVVTGMGAISCLGIGTAPFWQGLITGRSGIGPITKFDAEGLRNPEAGLIYDCPTDEMPDWARLMDESTRFAIKAALEATSQAGVVIGEAGPRTAVIMATNFGSVHAFQQWGTAAINGDETAEPRVFHDSLPPTTTNAIADLLGASGPRCTLSLSCSSGAAAIGVALDWLILGKADQIIAGGYDALSLYALAGLSCLRTVTTGKLQPFDKNRSGTVFGEGAGIMVLERLSRAKKRGANPLAVISGWAINNSAHHLTAPDTRGHGILHAMRQACHRAQQDPSKVDYVNAHGTGTRYNDPVETAALHSLLGTHAAQTPVSSIKASISHTMGAAGALEAIATILSIRNNVVPPTLNWQERDPECDLDYVPNEAREHRVDCALSLSSGIGGNNAALFFERVS